MSRKKFATQVDTDILTAVRAIAQEEVGSRHGRISSQPCASWFTAREIFSRKNEKGSAPCPKESIRKSRIQVW
jgi:hypothetical protein